jgi:hypothetical protein
VALAIILAIQEAEIRKVMVQSRPPVNSLKNPSQKRAGGVALNLNPSTTHTHTQSARTRDERTFE